MKSSETVLVTGASSGIGWELAICFASEGCRLVLIARSTEALETLATKLRREHGVEVMVLTCDLARPDSPRKIFADLQSRSVTVDVLVNNAGFGANGLFAELPVHREIEMIQVNITALMELTALFLPGMLARNRGGILNVGSVAGFQPGPGMAVYYATKAFVNSFTEALSEEVRSSKLTVSVLCPGPTESNFGKVARGDKTRLNKVSKMTSRTVAVLGHRAFRHQKVTIITGFLNFWLVFLVRLTPRWFPRRIVARYNRLNRKLHGYK
jgi:short-subunit dehydrogenase